MVDIRYRFRLGDMPGRAVLSGLTTLTTFLQCGPALLETLNGFVWECRQCKMQPRETVTNRRSIQTGQDQRVWVQIPPRQLFRASRRSL